MSSKCNSQVKSVKWWYINTLTLLAQKRPERFNHSLSTPNVWDRCESVIPFAWCPWCPRIESLHFVCFTQTWMKLLWHWTPTVSRCFTISTNSRVRCCWIQTTRDECVVCGSYGLNSQSVETTEYALAAFHRSLYSAQPPALCVTLRVSLMNSLAIGRSLSKLTDTLNRRARKQIIIALSDSDVDDDYDDDGNFGAESSGCAKGKHIAEVVNVSGY